MDAMQYSPLALAFIGDGVYEIRVREKLILEANMPADKLHKLTVERGRNAKGINAPKHSTVGEYRAATGLECLFGFLYLTGREERIGELFEAAWSVGSTNE